MKRFYLVILMIALLLPAFGYGQRREANRFQRYLPSDATLLDKKREGTGLEQSSYSANMNFERAKAFLQSKGLSLKVSGRGKEPRSSAKISYPPGYQSATGKVDQDLFVLVESHQYNKGTKSWLPRTRITFARMGTLESVKDLKGASTPSTPRVKRWRSKALR